MELNDLNAGFKRIVNMIGLNCLYICMFVCIYSYVCRLVFLCVCVGGMCECYCEPTASLFVYFVYKMPR